MLLIFTISILLHFQNLQLHLQEADEKRERSGDRDPEREPVVERAPVDLVGEPCVRVRVAPRRDARRRRIREPHYGTAHHYADDRERSCAQTNQSTK